jgi:ATP-binding cassette subfamily B protein
LTTRVRSAATTSGSLSHALLFLQDFEGFRRLRPDPAEPPEPTAEPTARATAEPTAGTTPGDGSGAPAAGGHVTVERVSFRYPGTDALVLDDVSLEIGPGEIVALVGLSGSGKTTLAHLVAGLYRPTTGRITFQGRDIATLPPTAYWPSVAAVFQDFVRYELTARENVAVSDHTRLDDHVGIRAAAARAGIEQALDRLPGGYETMMSRAYDGGADLSVGQWQRLAVARAFFREAPLLILDEPAAALDAVAEQRLYERLVELCRSRSVLLISHRFSTVRLADRICVLQDGRVTEQGTHTELMDLGGRYAELFTLQASSYMADMADPVRGPT